MARVYILGAGFSRAVSARMPMLGGLSDAVMSHLHTDNDHSRHDPGPYGGDVERWLSALAEPGPWLDDVDQLLSQARFYDVSDAVASVIESKEAQALKEGTCPGWLSKIVESWDDERVTVITFNYDRLVEVVYTTLEDKNWPPELYGIPLTNASLRISGTYAPRAKVTFKLLKLHGSLAWHYSGLSGGPHDPIYFVPWIGGFRDGIKLAREDHAYLVEDKKPFIVPPAAAKSPFYANRLLAAQWKQAAKALRAMTPNDELVLMGYSLPLTDLGVTSLISTQLPEGVPITPVNPSEEVLRNLRKLMPTRERDIRTRYIRADPIPLWVDEEVRVLR